eukprot:363759-Chlamydomonas_euryale.AAC.12
MQWLRQAAAGRQNYTEVAEGYGHPPDLEEPSVPGGKQMKITFPGLPADSPVAAQGHMPCMGVGHCTPRVEICCDCHIVQGQRPQRRGGSYRGFSLLSIAGKVYAMLLLRRLVEQIEPNLHRARMV